MDNGNNGNNNIPNGNIQSGSYPNGNVQSGSYPNGNVQSGSYPNGNVAGVNYSYPDANGTVPNGMNQGSMQGAYPNYADPNAMPGVNPNNLPPNAMPGVNPNMQYDPNGWQYMNRMPAAADSNAMSSAKKTFLSLYMITEGVGFLALASLFTFFSIGTFVPVTFILALCFGFLSIADFVRVFKKKYPKSLLKAFSSTIIFLVCAAIVFVRPMNFKSHNESRYTMQNAYVDMVSDTEDFFPDELPDDLEDYKIQVKNKAVGKSTWASLCYELGDPSDYRAWRNLEKIVDDESFSLLQEVTPVKLKEISKLEKKGIYVKYDEDFWDSLENKAYVIVRSHSGTKRLPKSKAIIICPEKGMVEFSVLDN